MTGERIAAVGQALGIDATPVVERALRSGLALARGRLGVDGRGERLRLSAPCEPGTRADVHTLLAVEPHADSTGALLGALAPVGSELAIELDVDRAGRVGVATVVRGSWPHDAALGALVALAPLDSDAASVLADHVDTLEGSAVGVTAVATRFTQPGNHTVELQLSLPTPDPRVEVRLVALADALHLPGAQRDLLAGLGPVLGATSGPALFATLHASAAGVLPRLGVRWRAAPRELIERVLVGVGAGTDAEIEHRLAALGVTASSGFELVLAPGAPIAHVDR